MSGNNEDIFKQVTEQHKANREAEQLEAQRRLAAEAIVAGDFVPTIDDKVRTVAYFALGIGAPAVGLTTGITAIWFPHIADNVAATGIVVLSFLGAIGGVFGIMNRPTKYPVLKA